MIYKVKEFVIVRLHLIFSQFYKILMNNCGMLFVMILGM